MSHIRELPVDYVMFYGVYPGTGQN